MIHEITPIQIHKAVALVFKVAEEILSKLELSDLVSASLVDLFQTDNLHLKQGLNRASRRA